MNTAVLYIYMILKRNYLQHIINLVVTVAIMCFLCMFSFYVPVGAGERLSLSLSIVIAISVYQTLISDLVPTGVDHTPILSQGWCTS